MKTYTVKLKRKNKDGVWREEILVRPVFSVNDRHFSKANKLAIKSARP